MPRIAVALLVSGLLVSGLMVCGAGCGSDAEKSETTTADVIPIGLGSHAFDVDVWADNWFAMYVNGVVVGQDSVRVTTERSFNKESFTFTADYPFTLGILGKDYMASESGLEYIGTDRQQMGDGGVIAQITDKATGTVVAATDATWQTFVVQQAPTNKDCASSATPDVDCKSVRVAEPVNWSTADFDAAGWTDASTYTADEVGVKDGYAEVEWDSTASLVWGPDLQTDNIVLFRTLVTG